MPKNIYQTTYDNSVLTDVSKIFVAFVDELSRLISTFTLSSIASGKSGIWRSMSNKNRVEELIHLLSESLVLYVEDAILKQWTRAETKMNNRVKEIIASTPRPFTPDELVHLFNINLNNLPASSFSIENLGSFSFNKGKLKAFISGSGVEHGLSVRERVEAIIGYLLQDVEFIVKENFDVAGSRENMDSHFRELMIPIKYNRNLVFTQYLELVKLLSKISYVEAMISRRELLENVVPEYRSPN